MKLKAYKGKKPYIFVSYAHKNDTKVLPRIESLQQRGFWVWFDQGIEAGTEWPRYIATHKFHRTILDVGLSEYFQENFADAILISL